MNTNTGEISLRGFYEETTPCDVPIEIVEASIKRIFPTIQKKEIKFLYHGTYNVFEVKQDYIFRFPDKSLFNSKGFDLIQRENDLLDLLRPNISVQIPQFLYRSFNLKIPFVGYERIPGQSLSRCFSQATAEQRRSLAKQIGKFLSELHSMNIYKIIAQRWPASFFSVNYQKKWDEFFLEVQEKLFPLFSDKQKEWVKRLFTDFLENSANFSFAPRVTHRDFDTSNILVDPDSFCITGIIDFEDTGVSDPAADFLFLGEGIHFLEQIFANYQEIVDSNFPRRMDFYEGRIPVIYLLTGYNLKYPRMIDAGFQMLRYRMEMTTPAGSFSPYSDLFGSMNRDR